MVYVKGWHKEMLLVGRAWQMAATADTYGISSEAFIDGVSVVHKGSYNALGAINEVLRYRSRQYNQINGFNFPAAFHQLEKISGCDIDTAFKWTLLAFKYQLSLEDVAGVLDRDYRRVGILFSEGYEFNAVLGIIDNDIDITLIYALVQ